MPRPPVEVADIIRAAGESFFGSSRKWLTWLHLKVLNAILRCRTAALGGHVDACSKCGHEAVSFNSCRNRHCPKCQANARDRWLEARAKELLPTRYVHVVFTLPRHLSPLALQNKREIYAMLFRASCRDADRDRPRSQAPWCGDRILQCPSHLEPETPASSARSLRGSRTRSGAGPFAVDRFAAEVLPAGLCSQRGVSGQVCGRPQRTPCGAQAPLPRKPHRPSNPKAFAAWLRPLFRSPWVVYSKRPFGGAQHALRYLGQYTHRVAISNHRLVALADGIVTFRWRDSAHKNKKRLMTLPVDEFLRRFLLHVLPPGFVRIRHFGLMAHRRRGVSLPLCLQLLAKSGRVRSTAGNDGSAGSPPRQLWTCPHCGGPMVLIERLTAIELRLRSPPILATRRP
jgi:hypothetical protein